MLFTTLLPDLRYITNLLSIVYNINTSLLTLLYCYIACDVKSDVNERYNNVTMLTDWLRSDVKQHLTDWLHSVVKQHLTD